MQTLSVCRPRTQLDFLIPVPPADSEYVPPHHALSISFVGIPAALQNRLLHPLVLLSYGMSMSAACSSCVDDCRSILPTVTHRSIRVTFHHLNSSADLDRSNILNAYVSGMKEDLNMHGTDFNVIYESIIGFVLLN